MAVIIPPIGSAAQYQFIDAFSQLNGIYVIRTLTNFATAKENAYPIVDVYTAVGLTDADYTNAWVYFQSDRVLQLESVVDQDIIYYIPESLIVGVPDINIVAVNTVSLRINIGQFITPDLITIAAVKSEVDDLIASFTGTTNQTSLHVANTVYMTQSEYNDIATIRNSQRREVESLKRKLVAANKEISRLSTKIGAYEDVISTLSTPVP